MSPTLNRLTGAVVVSGLLALSAVFAAPPVQSVPSVDLQRYAGTWYELARLPNRFQDKCVGDVTATYAPNADGSVQVVNRCRTRDGDMTTSEGRATRAKGVPSGAQLEVSFLPAWLQWFPLGRGDYWVVMLDADYRYAVVSEPSREYLWVLSRTPSLDADTYASITEQLRAGGYPVDQLVRTPQNGAPVTPAASAAATPPASAAGAGSAPAGR